MRAIIRSCFPGVLLCVVSAVSAHAEPLMFVFNSDGGAAAIAHVKGKVTADVVCHELNELAGTAVTDFFWCPVVGGNVVIYPTKVGERMGDNIRDWEQIHPYYRQQGRAMADNLKQLIERGDDPIKMLSARARKLEIRFWLSCRMNEIHEDDDRFTVVRSMFKEKHPELLHGKNYHPGAIYAPNSPLKIAFCHPRALLPAGPARYSRTAKHAGPVSRHRVDEFYHGNGTTPEGTAAGTVGGHAADGGRAAARVL